jgi:integrase
MPFGELFKAAENSPIRIPIMLASYYALRRSEVLGVRWSNIDFKNKVIKIAHKVVDGKKVRIAKSTGEEIK